MTTRINPLYALIMVVGMTICDNASAQLKQFTMEDLNFGGINYRHMTPANKTLLWWGDHLIAVEDDLCAEVNKKNGTQATLFALDDINTIIDGEGDTAMKSLRGVTFPYPSESIAALHHADSLYLIDWEKGFVVARYGCERTMAEDFCAASKALAYVQDDNLFVADASGTTTRLTDDGSREIVYGQPVHRDEFGIVKGTFWNNGGTMLAFYRMDQSMVTDYPLVDIDTRIATDVPEKYPMAGETSHKVTIGVHDIANGRTYYLNAGDPTDRYFTNIAWSPDDSTIYLIEVNRDQTDMSLDAYCAATGEKVATVYSEHHDKYVHPMTPITFLPWDADKFILQSARDGYNHLYLFDTKQETQRQLTSGDWVVLSIIGFNEKTKSVIINSTEACPIQNNLYSVDIATGKRTALDDGKGCHGTGRGTILSASGAWMVDTYSEPDVPRRIDIVETKTGKSVNYFAAADPWDGYAVPQFACGTIKAADGTTDLYYRMVLPPDFDATKKYPTVVYVYGGPGIRNVEARWHYAYRGWEVYMAQKGYILFILDNRGSSDRGMAFEQVTFRRLGEEEMKDQIAGVDFLKTLPYVDADRLGVHGWSYGGYMTTSLMTTYPDVFKVGVAGGPVIDWRYYEVMYGERYMDTPDANPEGYEATSLLNKAANLKGKLQIIIGMNDPVVVPQHSLAFLKACIEAGTQPDFFVYPGEPHNMRGHQSVHLHERITQYFEDYLK